MKGKDMVKDEEKGRERDKEEVTLDASLDKPRKRKADQALLQEDPIAQTSETPSLDSPSSLSEEMTVEKSGEVIRKDRRKGLEEF